MKKIFTLSIINLAILCFTAFLPAQAQTTYTFADYPEGTQYAVNEAHVLDDDVTVYTTQCHFRQEIRVYDSESHDGFFNSNALPLYIDSLVFNVGNKNANANIYGSTDGNTWTLVGSMVVTSSYQNRGISFGDNDYNFFKFDADGGQLRVKTMTIYYKTTGPNGNVAATPTFDPAGCVFFNPSNVTIDCETDGASIYYTTDGTDPDSTSTLYSTPIAINETTTLKAIAYAPGVSASYISTATYYIPLEVANIAAFKAANTNTNPQPYKITGDVTFVYKHGANIYVQDATGGLLIYNDGNLITQEYEEGDVISGGVYGTCSLYYGLVEMKPVANTAASTINNGPVVPEVVSISTLIDDYDTYESKLVKITDVVFPEGGTFSTTQATNMAIAQGTDTINCRNNHKTLDLTIPANYNADVTGFAAIFYSNVQIVPRDNNDIVEASTTPTAATPVITATGTPAEGADNYYSTANITITCETEGATIHYTTDGTTPTATSATYSAAFDITETTTIKAIAIAEDYLNSSVATKLITITTPTAETPVIIATGTSSGNPDSYYITANIAISAPTEGTTVYYTTNGTEPTAESTAYTEAFEITETTTIKAIAIGEGYLNSEVATLTVTIEHPLVEAPVFAPISGSYADSVEFSITCPTEDATIRYTLDGTEPTEEAEIFSEPIILRTTTTVKAKAFKTDWIASNTTTATYNIVHEASLSVAPEALTFNSTELEKEFVVSGVYLTENIVLTCNDNHFTLSDDTIESDAGNTTVTITFDGTEPATGLVTITSSDLTAQVTLTATATLPAPTFSPEDGATDTLLTITLTDAMADAEIRYTMDGTTPEATSTLYSEPIVLNVPNTYTINAIAIKEGWDNSDVATATYTVTEPEPAFEDSLVYYTGFEAEEGFEATTVYNNATEAFSGATTTQWATVYGTPSTTSPINGAQAMQMRWYSSATDITAYTRMNFDIQHATRVTFSAKATNGNNVAVSHSTDGGNTYVEPTIIELGADAATYQYVICEDGQFDNVRLKFALVLPEEPTNKSRVYIDSVSVFAMPGMESHTVDMPVITPNSGTYYEPVQVSITCPTEGANIYYTIDGTEPTDASTLYTTAFEVTEETTVKARAYKFGFTASNIATANYSFPVEVANIAAFKAASTSTNSTVYQITGDVTFVYRNGRNMYIQDATAGLLVYDSGDKITTNYVEGDVIPGGIAGTYSLYNGLVEMVPTANTAEATVNNGPIEPEVVSIEDIEGLYNTYESKLVTIQDVIFPEGGTFSTEQATNMTIQQGSDQMTCRNTHKTMDLTIPAGFNANVTGFVLQFNDSYQIAPRGNNDIEEIEMETVATPVITKTPIDGNSASITITCATEGASIFYTTNGNDPNVNSGHYSDPITLDAGTWTVKAIGIKEGMQNSEIATETFIVSINDVDFNKIVTIYPNPTTDHVIISYNDLDVERIELYTITGQLVESVKAEPDQTTISVNTLPNGLYFARLVGDNFTTIHKINKH